VREHAIVGDDGVEREVDTIVFGTGFRVTEMPVASHIRGRDGALLADVWQGSPQALLGAAVTGFPNFFMMLGPNTGLGHTSQIVMIEGQIQYIAGALRTMQSRGAAVLEALPAAQAAFNDEVQRRLQPTVWNSGGCRSWYLDRNGRNSTLWPGSTWSFRTRTRRFDPAAFRLG
jgi:cation diffusion facilitator CzcD-associated flavoprotein CzcO